MNHCTLTGNWASWSGGGRVPGALTNCTLAGNSAFSFAGGASFATLANCTLTGNSAYSYAGGVCSGTLNNCTLTGNSALQQGGGSDEATLNNCLLIGNSAADGGGAYSGTLVNCTLIGNSATNQGGGAYSGTLTNCALSDNSATYGGGANSVRLNNCTLTGNWASYGGGAYSSTLNNCIACFNNAWLGPNYYSGTLNYCCTTPLPVGGTGNLTADPQLASPSHLSAASPCRGAGNASYVSGVDIDGEPWANPPSVGCDEFYPSTATGALGLGIQAAYTNVAVGFVVDFIGNIAGCASASAWDFADGTIVSNQPCASHAWVAAGDYTVTLRAYNDSDPAGVAATIVVHVVAQPVHYVA